jgi:hypothetical protein
MRKAEQDRNPAHFGGRRKLRDSKTARVGATPPVEYCGSGLPVWLWTSRIQPIR